MININLKWTYLFLLVVLMTIIQLFACDSSDETIGLEGDPGQVSLEVEVSDLGDGQVTIISMAENATFYEFYPNDGTNIDPIVTTSGEFQYFYTTLGTHTIEVRAYGSNGRYTKAERTILVEGQNRADVREGYTTPLEYEGMELIWNDEFSGNSLNADSWSYEIGNGCPNLCGWGNNELQYYRRENTSVEEGVLTIEAKAESFEGNRYTSSRLLTRDKFSFTYGRVDVRAVLPKGQGLWPAVWMLGQNHVQVGWPQSGEIDIMEMVGGQRRERTAHGTAHWDNDGHASHSGSRTLEQGLNEGYHVYSIIWDEEQIIWLLDDVEYHRFTITTTDRLEFHNPFYLLINVAVGGNWPGNPDETTIFPTSMSVDYIRVFQNL